MRTMLRSGALIEAWFDSLAPAQAELARHLREVVLDAEPGLVPAVKWGNLVFSLQRDHLLAIVAYRDHLNLQVFNGARLLARHPGLSGSGKGLRHLRLALGAPLPGDRVRRLVADAAADLRMAGPVRPPRDGTAQ